MSKFRRDHEHLSIGQLSHTTTTACHQVLLCLAKFEGMLSKRQRTQSKLHKRMGKKKKRTQLSFQLNFQFF